ncbi:MAG TPA: hypothetical protein VHN18_05430 [Micromonosporaceae bacterium]|nr:hypothetical protein [Micromonosporaceae bacterium]
MKLPHRWATVPAALGFALGAVLLGAAPAAAGDTALTLTPETVRAGDVVGIEADCKDRSAPATVESDAFATVTLKEQGNLLTAAALVPEATPAGTYPVKLNCTGTEFAMENLTVVSNVQPPRGPATGFGGTASSSGATLLLTGGIAVVVAGAALGLSTALRRGTFRRGRLRS